jgi:riboflavin kinase/FMN adenylyltransferase
VSHRAVLNIGCRPTLRRQAAQVHVEVHLLEFSGDLYGAEMEVSFAGRLRDERPFDSMIALREQIVRDVAAAKRLF